MSQPATLKEQLKALENLQELDLKIDSLKKNKNALPAALRGLDDSLGKIRAGVEAKKAALAEIEKVQRQTSAAQDINKDRVARSTARLESVQNSQEYQAVQKEIEQLRKLAGTFEEQSKKSVHDHDAIGKEIETLTAQMAKLQDERNTQATQVTGQSDQVQNEITSLVSERSKYIPKVEARLVSQYDRIRGARGGLGIVPAIAGRCKACNMMVPAQMYNELQKGLVLHSCPSCNRLLFAPETATGK